MATSGAMYSFTTFCTLWFEVFGYILDNVLLEVLVGYLLGNVWFEAFIGSIRSRVHRVHGPACGGDGHLKGATVFTGGRRCASRAGHAGRGSPQLHGAVSRPYYPLARRGLSLLCLQAQCLPTARRPPFSSN